MADTRNPGGRPDNLSRERSLLRRQRPGSLLSPHDKRPAGPSSYSDPGMGSPSPALPPGVKPGHANAVSESSVAGSFRHDFGVEPEEDPMFNEQVKDGSHEQRSTAP